MSPRTDDAQHPLALLQRAVDLLVKLIGGRIELAVRELRASAGETGQLAVLGLAGALALTVGALLLALAVAELLAPLLGRALGLLLVALPFLVGGGAVLRRARRSERPAEIAPELRNAQSEQPQHEQRMQDRAGQEAGQQRAEPEHDQSPGEPPEHRVTW